MKKLKYIVLLVSSLALLNMQCDEDNIAPISNCDTDVIIDNSAYQNEASGFFSLISAEINEDCFNVHISASGCDGSTWVLELIDSDNIQESLPPQRNLKLVLTNNEACLAVFTKEQSFDLTSLRIDGINEFVLNVDDFPNPITYTY